MGPRVPFFSASPNRQLQLRSSPTCSSSPALPRPVRRPYSVIHTSPLPQTGSLPNTDRTTQRHLVTTPLASRGHPGRTEQHPPTPPHLPLTCSGRDPTPRHTPPVLASPRADPWHGHNVHFARHGHGHEWHRGGRGHPRRPGGIQWPRGNRRLGPPSPQQCRRTKTQAPGLYDM